MITNLTELAAVLADAKVTICDIAGTPTVRGRFGRIYHDTKTPRFVFIRDESWDFSKFDPNNERHLKTAAAACGLCLRVHVQAKRDYQDRRAQLIAATRGRRAAAKQRREPTA